MGLQGLVGVVYPQRKPRGFHEATYLGAVLRHHRIGTFSFYRPIAPKAAAGWVRRSPPNPRFRFTGKMWRGFTHERNATDADGQPSGWIRAAVEANRLGAVLLQFPWSFRNTEENRD